MVRSLNDDQEAYQTFLRRVAAMVRGYLFNTMGAATRTPDKIEDLVQDVLLALHRKKHLYQPTRPILPWLFAIARYRVIDAVRAEKRRPALTEWEDGFEPAAPEPAPLSDEKIWELEELLSCLSPKQKDILILAKVERLPLNDIAQRFGMSLSAVKVTIHRTVQKLRKKRRESAL